MNGFFQRLLVLVVSTAAAFSAWKYGAGTPVDRAAFTTVASSYANPPLFVTGDGTHSSPWKLRVFSAEQKPDKRQAPVIVSLGDDLEGFFQSFPPAPIDLAVIFTNFQRLGAKKAATAAVFSWESPDPVGFAALETALGKFESLVMAAPLSRGAVPSPMPPSFRRASIPYSSIKGDGSLIPVVNRIPIPNVLLSGEKTITGFTALEIEAPSPFIPLLARWDDRVVFSFPMLTVLQRLNISPESLEIRPGQYLKIGPDGPVLPIDIYGRLSTPLKTMSAYAEIPAESLIDGGDDLFPKSAPEPVILRDDRSGADSATRAFSKSLSVAVAAIASEDGLAKLNQYPRLKREWELGLLGGAVLLIVIFCGRARFAAYIFAAVLAALFVSFQWIAFGTASVWLPGVPALAALSAGVFVAVITTRSPADLSSQMAYPESPPAPEGPESGMVEQTVVVWSSAEPKPEELPVPTKKAPSQGLETSPRAKPPAKTPPKKAVPTKTATKKPGRGKKGQ